MSASSKIKKTSEDGHEYIVLKTPAIVSISDIQYSNSIENGDGYKFHHFFIKCRVLRELALPLDANPREPTRAKVVNEMASTLRENPDKFHHWNNGITLICDELQYKDSKVSIKFDTGSGVCNGGHTYFSIITFPGDIPENAFVHLEVIDLPGDLQGDDRRKVINDIARNRNANRQLAPTTQADYLGFYDCFKKALGNHSSRVIWHEGDSQADQDAIGSELLIRMLASLDPLWFSHPVHSPAGKPTHKNAATGSRGIHNKWYDGQNDPESNLKHMAPLAIEAFRISEIVSHSLRNDDLKSVGLKWRKTNFYQWLNEKEAKLRYFQPGKTGILSPNPARIMFLGFFRSNVWLGLDEDGKPRFVGTLVEPETLWSEGKVELLKKLTTSFDDSGQDPYQFIKNSAPYENQLLALVYGKRPPSNPIRFFDVETGVEFAQDSIGATHILSCDAEGWASVEIIDRKIMAKDEQKYRKL